MDREEEREIEKYATSGKSQGLPGLKKKRETDRVVEEEMLIAAADNSQRFFKMMRG